MEDRSFQRFGSICALGAAAAWLISAILLYLGRGPGGLSDVLSVRVHSPQVNYVLAAGGLLVLAPIVALYDRLRAGGGWMRWAALLGFVGGTMTAAQCLWDGLRYPQLQAMWDTGEPVSQSVVRVLLSIPNPVDPRGLGAHLFVGVFVLVCGWIMLRERWPLWLGPLGLVEGVLLVLVFATGVASLETARTALAAVAVGALGPLWWLLAGIELWRRPAS